MSKDELKGKPEALKGKIEQGAGELTNDPDLHDEGVADEVAGQTRTLWGTHGERSATPSERLGRP
jgi:uncharacterized protein YjbJ (UPF0337 family)